MQAGTGVPSAAASVQQELTITGCAEPRPPLPVHTCEQTDNTGDAAEDVTIGGTNGLVSFYYFFIFSVTIIELQLEVRT